MLQRFNIWKIRDICPDIRPPEIEIEKELNIDIKTEVEAENRKLSSATAELCL